MSEKAPKKKVAKKRAAKPKAAKKKPEPKPKAESEAGEAVAPVVSAGPSPQAMVESRFKGGMVERHAKGFSFGELAAVGLTKVAALGLGVPIDVRRRSSLDDNVGALKSWYKPAPKKAKEPKPEKAKPAKRAKKTAKKTKKEQA
jgi:ribosomal protein L13E